MTNDLVIPGGGGPVEVGEGVSDRRAWGLISDLVITGTKGPGEVGEGVSEDRRSWELMSGLVCEAPNDVGEGV